MAYYVKAYPHDGMDGLGALLNGLMGGPFLGLLAGILSYPHLHRWFQFKQQTGQGRLGQFLRR